MQLLRQLKYFYHLGVHLHQQHFDHRASLFSQYFRELVFQTDLKEGCCWQYQKVSILSCSWILRRYCPYRTALYSGRNSFRHIVSQLENGSRLRRDSNVPTKMGCYFDFGLVLGVYGSSIWIRLVQMRGSRIWHGGVDD